MLIIYLQRFNLICIATSSSILYISSTVEKMLALTLWCGILLSAIMSSVCQNSAPLVVSKVSNGDILSFHGEKTVPFNYQTTKYLQKWYYGSDVLLLSGQEYVFMLNTTQVIGSNDEASCIGAIRWVSDSSHHDSCRQKGKLEYHCHNFIRVVERVQNNRLYVCGTNAYAPTCRFYNKHQFRLPDGNQNNSVFEQENVCISQQCECPSNPYTSSAVLYSEDTDSGPHIFASVINDFLDENDVLLRKRVTNTDDFISTDKSWMSYPTFLKMIEYGNKIYLFFIEKASAVETGTESTALYARVAQVCKNDIKSNSKLLRNQWSSFVKARLRCTLKDPSGSELDFNNLTSVSEIVTMQLKPDTQAEDVVLATFSTPWAWYSAQLSSVCAFSLRDIQTVFETGSFFTQSEDGRRSEPIPATDVPVPRLGICTNSSLDDSVLYFAKKNHLMYDSITTKQPLYVSEPGIRMTQVTVDVNAGKTGNIIVYVGTEDAQALRLRPLLDKHKGYTKLVLLEQRQLVSEELCSSASSRAVAVQCTVHEMKILPQKTQPISQPLLYIAFTDRVSFVKLVVCDQYISPACCNFDPNCSWLMDKCKDRYQLEGTEVPSISFEIPMNCAAEQLPTSAPTAVPVPNGAGVGMFMIGFLVGVVFVLAILLAKRWNYCGVVGTNLKSVAGPSSSDVKLSPVLLDTTNVDGINQAGEKDGPDMDQVTVSTPLREIDNEGSSSTESKPLQPEQGIILKPDEITLMDEELSNQASELTHNNSDKDVNISGVAENNIEYTRLESISSEPV